MLQVAMEASLHDTSMIGSSGSKTIEEVVPRLSRVIVEIGIDTQVEATPVFGVPLKLSLSKGSLLSLHFIFSLFFHLGHCYFIFSRVKVPSYLPFWLFFLLS